MTAVTLHPHTEFKHVLGKFWEKAILNPVCMVKETVGDAHGGVDGFALLSIKGFDRTFQFEKCMFDRIVIEYHNQSEIVDLFLDGDKRKWHFRFFKSGTYILNGRNKSKNIDLFFISVEGDSVFYKDLTNPTSQKIKVPYQSDLKGVVDMILDVTREVILEKKGL